MKRAQTAKKSNPQKSQKTSKPNAAPEKPKRRKITLPETMEWYRPIKKPVTLRVDADVLAWFKKSGRGYQTRINRSLRDLMTEEMKNGKKTSGG
jgi:uncharacterized protein (DUF4415 family)